MIATTEVRAGIALRISADPNDLRHGVDRQRPLCHDLADKLAWGVADEYLDNNRSAYKIGAKRPEYDRLLADIEAGRINAVIAYDQDRIARRSEGWGKFRALCKRKGVRVAFVTEGIESAISSASGGVATGIKAVVSEYESEIKGERVRDAHNARALAGKTAGKLAYGWRRVVEFNDRGVKLDWHDEVDEDKAAIVIECATRLLAGESLLRIATDLNERGVPTPNAGRPSGEGDTWQAITIRQLVQRPANIGQRTHRGVVLPGVVADAPAIMSLDMHARVCALLQDPARRRTVDNRVKHLLTFVATCGACGAGMRFRIERPRPGNRRRNEATSYVCSRSGCTRVDEAHADEWITEAALAYLARIDAADLLGDEDTDVTAAAREAETLRARLAERKLMFDEGELTRAEWLETKGRIQPKLDAALNAAKLTVLPGIDIATSLMLADDIAAAWETLAIEQRRQLLTTLFVIEVERRTDRREQPRLTMRRRGQADGEQVAESA